MSQNYRYERLSGQDGAFLSGETPTAHMHIGGVSVFESGDLATGAGGIDFPRLRAATESVLHDIPRYRERLMWTPLTGNAVWVDDPDFNLDYHLRHTSLPKPGGPQQLKALAGRIMAKQLDRERPLWEVWFVEGLSGGERYAMIHKIHHCMIDGVSGADLSQILFSLQPESEIPPPEPYVPRPSPGRGELLRDELLNRARIPFELLRGLQSLRGEGQAVARVQAIQRLRAVGALVAQAFDPPSATPINGPLGPHRRFDWLTLPLADVKALRRAGDCTINDVVLAIASGAFREYLALRSVDPAQLQFRASAPVSMRSEAERGTLGNRVSSWLLRLPLEIADPLERLRALRESTRALKEENQALGVETMMQVAEWTPPVLLSLGVQAAGGQANTIITNVPGPQFPLYMLGSRLLYMYPMAPLLDGIGVAIALFSYNGKLSWGFVADYNLLPDLSVFVRAVQSSFDELAKALDVQTTVDDL